MKSPVTISPALLATAAVAVGCSGPASDDGGTDNNTKDDTTIETGTPPSTLPSVKVNEILAWNTTGLQDEVGAFPDWIELFNASDEPADLSGWWLTDDVANPFNWLFPDGTTIPAGGYLVVFADGDEEEGPLHASFSLKSTGGEDVSVYGPNVLDNPLIDSKEDLEPFAHDISIQRSPDGSDTWSPGPPSPGAAND
ncbi:MAG: lamin tail domain-containing protein [Myxococcota bacterium]